MPTDLLATVTELARRARPPLTVVGSSATGSFDDALVELRDGHVLWRFVRERSVLGLVASPEFDRSVWYDADLLKRLLGHGAETRRHSAPESTTALRELMRQSVDDLAKELEQLREPVAAAFAEQTWASTRGQLLALGRQRDAELFGRPQRLPEK